MTSLLQTTIAQEQNITINTEIVEGGFREFLYSEDTKYAIIGSAVTLTTIMVGLAAYYLMKNW